MIQHLIKALQSNCPQLRFMPDTSFYWSPKDATIHYPANHDSKYAQQQLLHEVAHALLGHTTYESDINLLHIEIAAWEKAIELAAEYHLQIDREHIESCLDTYRDWLHNRATCPECNAAGLQHPAGTYTCVNCSCVWSVTDQRLCRTYRLKVNNEHKKDPG